MKLSRVSLTLLLLVFVASLARADDAEVVPHFANQPGYHRATLELARYCLDQGLVSECRKLIAQITRDSRRSKEADEARELNKSIAEGRTDEYSAARWSGYLDKREALAVRRGQGAMKALGAAGARSVLYLDANNADARKALDHEWVEGLGWHEAKEAERLRGLCVRTATATDKAPREATWESPYVLLGEHFTLVTDLPWSRAIKYSRLLDRFHGVFFEILGDMIPRRAAPNVVYCCKAAKTFAAFSRECGLPFGELSSGMYVQHLGASVVNAERADFVGRKNSSKDNLARTFYHECTHRLVDIGLRGLCGDERMTSYSTTEHAWIVEAIAIVFEGLEIQDKSHSLKGLEFQRTYTIDKHFKPKKKTPDAATIMRQGHAAFAAETPVDSAQKYAVAGSIAWYCLFHRPKDYRAAFLGLLLDYYRGDTACRDFKSRFGQGMDDFVKEWSAWVLK